MAREPGYCHHRPTGQAYVRFSGKTVYLGPYGSPESALGVRSAGCYSTSGRETHRPAFVGLSGLGKTHLI